jgi:hypothetical protein
MSQKWRIRNKWGEYPIMPNYPINRRTFLEINALSGLSLIANKVESKPEGI